MDIDPTKLFKVQQCIGKGTFGDVYKCKEISSGKIVAIKVINLEESSEEIDLLVQEINFLSQLKSPHITSYYATYVKNCSMWISMEFCEGGSCSDLLRIFKELDEDVAAFIVRDCLKGLQYLHQMQKIHRDIKCANILLTLDGQVKLADFGVSGDLSNSQAKKYTFVGTPLWMAPEVISREKEGYDEKCDIWSLGITTIELITGAPPHSNLQPMKVLFEIPRLDPPVLKGSEYSDRLTSFLKFSLQKDPSQRSSATKLLLHPWLKLAFSQLHMAEFLGMRDEFFGRISTRVKKAPRYPLDLSSSAQKELDIQWEFSTKFHIPKPINLPSDDHVENSQSPLELLQMEKPNLTPSTDPTSMASSPKQKSRTFSLFHRKISAIKLNYQQLKQQKENLSPTKEPLKQIRLTNGTTENIPQEKMKQFKAYDPLKVWSLLFDNIKKRSKTPEVKALVEELQQVFLAYEKLSPGVSGVLCEELYLNISHLVSEVKIQ